MKDDEKLIVKVDSKTAAMFWCRDFNLRVNAVETAYHAWQLAKDACAKKRKADPTSMETLIVREGELREYYLQQSNDLHRWVTTHPVPAGADAL